MSFSSSGIGCLECLLSKCCLYVLGSGIAVLQCDWSVQFIFIKKEKYSHLQMVQTDLRPAAAVLALSCFELPA